jgi:hypothetical protein
MSCGGISGFRLVHALIEDLLQTEIGGTISNACLRKIFLNPAREHERLRALQGAPQLAWRYPITAAKYHYYQRPALAGECIYKNVRLYP